MDYMELIQRSLQNAWRFRALWLFGFFVSAGSGPNGIMSKWDAEDLRWLHKLDVPNIPVEVIPLIILGVVALMVIFWVLSVLGEGSLIHGICLGEQNREVGFADCFTAGLNKFLRLFGIMLLAGLAVFTGIMALVVFIVPAYFISKGLGILLTVLALPVIVALILTAICVEGWAMRFAVIENRVWSDALARGWHLFKSNVGSTLAVAFSSFLTQMVLWFALVIGMAILAIPFVIAAQSDFWTSVAAGAAVGVTLIVLSAAIFGTFASSVWTLGFLRLTANGR